MLPGSCSLLLGCVKMPFCAALCCWPQAGLVKTLLQCLDVEGQEDISGEQFGLHRKKAQHVFL